jgi:son of sevenless
LNELFNPDLLYLKNVRYRVPLPEGPRAVVWALWDYQGEHDNQLGLKDGDTIEVLTRLESGWWDGISNQRRGWFPINYYTAAE